MACDCGVRNCPKRCATGYSSPWAQKRGPRKCAYVCGATRPLFGQAGAQGYAAQQREVARATGNPVDAVRVVEVTHLKYSGLNRPVSDLPVTGVDPQWKGATLP